MSTSRVPSCLWLVPVFVVCLAGTGCTEILSGMLRTHSGTGDCEKLCSRYPREDMSVCIAECVNPRDRSKR